MRGMPTSHPARVMVLTLSFGSGHVRAAGAIADAISAQDPDADVRVLDALDGCRLLFRAGYVWPYWAMVRHAPAVWARLFARRLARVSRRTAPAWAFRAGCPRVFDAIARFDPDIIIAVEVAACEMAAIAKQRALTNAFLLNVITDYHAEPAWVRPEVDRYAVADPAVGAQLRAWGAHANSIVATGIPVAAAFRRLWGANPTRHRQDGEGVRPMVVVMGGGMGPTRMDQVVARLCRGNVPMHVMAVTGHDHRARRRVARVRASERVALTVRGWADDVAALMQAAAVLVTKPGGVTIAEAAASHTPLVLFDPIPGPEEHNAAAVVASGAGCLTHGAPDTAAAVTSLLRDAHRRRRMSERARAAARPDAADVIARIALEAASRPTVAGPTLILTIGNGAGHTSVAWAIAEALQETGRSPVVIDVARYMSRAARLTHITAYLWIVRHAPSMWDRIDRYQKRQPHTSPEWYYRRTCRRVRNLVRQLRPDAMVTTEVGCCEIASLIKRDLGLCTPLIAVNGEYDCDRAWVQQEVDLYCVPTAAVQEQFCALGAPRERVRAWGVPLSSAFHASQDHDASRADVCRWLGLTVREPLVLIAGGSEGLGRVEAVATRLLRLAASCPQLVVLAGRNERVRRRCERLVHQHPGRVRVLGWTTRMPELMRAADLMVSKLGHTLDEAMASHLPIVALEPPPGAERVQYRSLDEWRIGRAVRTLDEMAAVVDALLATRGELETMREATRGHSTPLAAQRIAHWIRARDSSPANGATAPDFAAESAS